MPIWIDGAANDGRAALKELLQELGYRRDFIAVNDKLHQFFLGFIHGEHLATLGVNL